VLGQMNSCAAISLSDAPAPARSAAVRAAVTKLLMDAVRRYGLLDYIVDGQFEAVEAG
jgi:hypothetical protein